MRPERVCVCSVFLVLLVCSCSVFLDPLRALSTCSDIRFIFIRRLHPVFYDVSKKNVFPFCTGLKLIGPHCAWPGGPEFARGTRICRGQFDSTYVIPLHFIRCAEMRPERVCVCSVFLVLLVCSCSVFLDPLRALSTCSDIRFIFIRRLHPVFYDVSKKNVFPFCTGLKLIGPHCAWPGGAGFARGTRICRGGGSSRGPGVQGGRG